MSRVLFVHDGPLYSGDDGLYYGVHFNDTLRLRYLELGDSVTFMMRVYSLKLADTKNYSHIMDDHFSVVPIPNFKSIRLYLRNILKAKRIVEREVSEHDIIIVRMPSAVGNLAVRAARTLNKPFLIEYVACTFDAYWNYNWKGKVIAHFKRFQQRRIMRDVPYVIYVTNEFLQQRYPTNGQFIGCSDVELRDSNARNLKVRLDQLQSLDLSKPLVIGTVAALNVPYKGQADVIRAIALLREENLEFHYHLVGQGDPVVLKRLIAKLGVEDLVTILGPLKHEEVFEFYKTLHIYLQPSKQEGLPRAMIEAMSTGCPCLGARTAGIPELVQYDMVFEKGNVGQIMQKLKTFDREKLLAQAKANFSEALKYQNSLLKKRRSDFYSKFLREINLKTSA